MQQKLNMSEQEVNELVGEYSSMLFRIAYCILCNRADAQDAVQETFLKYLTKSPEFTGEEHRKAWLIRVCANISKNMLMFRLKRETINIDDMENIGVKETDIAVFEHIMSLPAKYKIVMTLHYVEGYKGKEIAEIINISEDAVRKRLQKGRELLKEKLETEERE